MSLRQVLWTALLLALPICAHAQPQVIYCNAGNLTACATSGNTGSGVTGDPVWKSFGKVNANFSALPAEFFTTLITTVPHGGTGASTITGLVFGNGASAMTAYGGTSCTNQFPRSLNASGVATCATVANTDLAHSSLTVNGTSIALGASGTLTLASSNFANQGATTQILQGNAAGNPSWVTPISMFSGTCNSSAVLLGSQACSGSPSLSGTITTATGGSSLAGAVTITAPGAGNVGLTVNGVAGTAATMIVGSSTSGQSQGLAVNAGTNSSDISLNITNQANSTVYFRVRGDGAIAAPQVTTGTNTDFVCFASGNIFTLQASACTISSLRFKTNLDLLRDASPIMQLHVRSFELKDTHNRDRNATHRQAGLIAEEVAAVMPLCAVYEDDMKTPKSYRPECIDAYLVKVAQDHQTVSTRQQWEIYLLMVWCLALTLWRTGWVSRARDLW